MQFLNINKSTLFIISLALLFVTVSFVNTAEAKVVVRGQESVQITDEQLVEGNFYTLSSNVSVAGMVTGDWLAIAEKISADGEYEEDLLFLSRLVEVLGPVGGDVRIVALNTELNDAVAGDVVVVGDSVNIKEESVIDGDLLVFANYVNIEGEIKGDVLGRVNDLVINGQVAGAVDVNVQILEFKENAQVEGNVTYVSAQPATQADSARLAGETNFIEQKTETSWHTTASDLIIPFLAIVFAALSFFLFAPRKIQSLIKYTQQRVWLNLSIGLGVLIFLPLLSLAFIASGLGSLVGFVLLALYMLLLVGSIVLAGPLTGWLVLKYALNRDQVDILSITSGVVMLYLVVLIPILGMVWFLFSVSVLLGAASIRVFAYRK